ncbi:MAG: signal peptide peptidase SppA [Syntrophaceae bacterium]
MSKITRMLCVLLTAFFFTGCAYVNVPLMPTPQPLQEQVIEGKGTAKILLMDITGVISEQDKEKMITGNVTPSMVAKVRETLQKANQDPNIVGVIIRINSPGGTITASDIIHHEIVRFRAQKKVPVYTCMTGLGASGAYYIATATDNITANPTSITGSIAVLMMTYNVEGLMNKIGVSELTFKSGDKKDILSPFRPATPEEKQIVQNIINQMHKRFVDKIMARPGNTLVRKEIEALADGRIYTAEQALTMKLIDRIGYLDDVITDMKKTIGVADARIVTYYQEGDYKGTIYSSSTAQSSRLTGMLTGGNGFDWLGETQFMYLWKP